MANSFPPQCLPPLPGPPPNGRGPYKGKAVLSYYSEWVGSWWGNGRRKEEGIVRVPAAFSGMVRFPPHALIGTAKVRSNISIS